MFMKKIACFLLASILAVQPMMANAVDLGSAFEALAGTGSAVSINSPGRFSSAARGGFSAGGIEMRVPRGQNTPQLLSVTPPRIVAGCNGISAHFGGFSFISGKEFGELLKQIASGAALGFVASLVMKTLCPACEAVVQELKSAAQMAAQMAKNGCQFGKEMGEKFLAGVNGGKEVSSLCENTAATYGAAGDTISAGSLCNTVKDARDWMQTFNKSTLPPNATDEEKKLAQKALDCAAGTGNLTWRNLTGFDSAGALKSVASGDVERKLILLNLLGAEMVFAGTEAGVACDTGDDGRWTAIGEAGKDKQWCRPPADLRIFTGLFLCGANGGQTGPNKLTSPAAKEFCDSYQPRGPGGKFTPGVTNGVFKVWDCVDAQGNKDYENCPVLQRVPASTIFTGDGFFVKINQLLLSAVQRLREGKGYDDDEGRQIITLIQSAPYPLYQAINAAAVYPAAAMDLLDTMSVLVAEQYTHAVFDEMLKLSARSSSSMCMTRPQAVQILDFVSQLRSENKSRMALIAQNFSIQQGLAEQIRQINLTIQRQVMSEDLLATGKLSETLNKALSPTNAGAGQAVPAAPTAPAAPSAP